MRSVQHFLFVLLVLLTASIPVNVFATDSTGGICSCELYYEPIAVDEEGQRYPATKKTVTLGDTYDDTKDDASCSAACEDYADEEEGLGLTYQVSVTGFDYQYPSEVEQEEAVEAEAEKEASKYLVPNLSVEIPGLTFSNILNKAGKLHINFVPEYLNALYTYALGVGALIAIVMIMIGGAQYILGSGLGSVEAGKKRIVNAVTGLVLLLSAYTLLYLVNPSLTQFGSVEVDLVAAIQADLDTAGPEGSTAGASTSSCTDAIAEAQSDVEDCPLSQLLYSPTNPDPAQATSSVKCGYHFREKNIGYDYTKMLYGLDFNGSWGDELYAPGSGTIRFVEGSAENRCGNAIYIDLDGGGTAIICHVKAWNTSVKNLTHVDAGDAIGYVGGKCCAGQELPNSKVWESATITGTCVYSGTECGSPGAGNTDCDCQAVTASGNSTGAHAHLTLKGSSGGIPVLMCLQGESSTEEAGESESSECTEACDENGENCECTEEET